MRSVDSGRSSVLCRLIAFPLVVALVVVTALVTWSGIAGAARAPEWDSRMLPIAEQVEELRGLAFKRPVQVEFLTDAAFQKRVGIDDDTLSKQARRDAERSEATLRATGLVPAGADLVGSTSDLRESGVLAYYDLETRQVTVRGKALDVPTRVTLVHELTHALQDQHFDLAKLQRAAAKAHGSAVVRAVTEGDARRVERAYVDQLSDEERAEYATWQGEQGGEITDQLDVDAVPGALIAFFQSPYLLGPEMLRIVAWDGGERAIDDLFRDMPVADLAYLDPRSLLRDRSVVAVTAPKLGRGEEQDGARDVFGAFALYLVLATSGDPVRALRVADGWGADRMVTFTRDGVTCVRATFVGATPSASRTIHDALADWAIARTDGAATVDAAGDESTLTACDRGAATVDPGTLPQAALVIVLLRNTLLAQGLEVVGERTASCIVDRTLDDASFESLVAAAIADPTAELDESVATSLQRGVSTAAMECAS